MIFLVLHDFIVEVDIWDGHDHFALPLLDICIAGCSFLLYRVSPRTSPCLMLFCLLLALLFCLLLALLFCLLLALLFCLLSAVLFSVERCSASASSFSLSSYPCCFTSSFSPQARWQWCCLGFSPRAPWLWRFLILSPLALWLWCYNSVARF